MIEVEDISIMIDMTHNNIIFPFFLNFNMNPKS